MINDWNNKLRMGLDCEEYIKNKFLINNMSLTRIYYENNPEMQKDGIDLITENNLKIGVRAGTFERYERYGKTDILLETWSVYEMEIYGWTYTTKSDIYLSTWWDKDKINLIDGYILYMKRVKPFFMKAEGNQLANKNKGYTSYSFPILITDFPYGSIQHIEEELNQGIISKDKVNINLKFKVD